MTVHQAIQALLDYAVEKGLMEATDRDYANNRLMDVLQLDYEPVPSTSYAIPDEPSSLLEPLLNHAVETGLIPIDTIKQRDIFEAKLMDIVIARPSTIINTFEAQKSPTEKTDYYYHLSQASNYIKTARTSKNMTWKATTPYGEIDITINLSKPEKDPKDIIAQGHTSNQNQYPKCLLCKENVGYNGTQTGVGRTNHRIIPLSLNNEPFYLQYSPYVYYNEHCIVLHRDHIPMNVTEATFKRLFDFIDQFPHYFLGSNAGLPIVGGSILSHEHYQGGRYHFAIEDAKVIQTFEKNHVTFEQLYWPLSVVRLRSTDKKRVIEEAMNLYAHWVSYHNEKLEIHSHTKGTPHNAITPIARRKDGLYELDMTLRNNRTSKTFPLGIFHPHPDHHHIKKENIGLIEVMGLAVLPARLKEELTTIKDVISSDLPCPDSLSHHAKWIKELKERWDNTNIDPFIEQEVAIKFIHVLENAGVFKQDDEGQTAFTTFLQEVQHG
jgi:UDPglucose--hexose-1-phosphate uridylyltransferase